MINQFQQQGSSYSKKQEERIIREYRVVRPDASDAEVREAIEDPNTQVFSQAVSIRRPPTAITFHSRQAVD
jgi:syntaxin 1B/2/3